MEGGYRNLIVWQKAKLLAIEVYKFTDSFPHHEQYGLVSQMRRAAVSIPSNIAEGYRRGFKKEMRQFFRIAFGSGAELETQIEIAENVLNLSKDSPSKSKALLEEVMKMLNALITSER